MLAEMQDNFTDDYEDALVKIRASTTKAESDKISEGFALMADGTDARYLTMVNCDLRMLEDEFSKKPYAWAVQKSSPLKDELNHGCAHNFF